MLLWAKLIRPGSLDGIPLPCGHQPDLGSVATNLLLGRRWVASLQGNQAAGT